MNNTDLQADDATETCADEGRSAAAAAVELEMARAHRNRERPTTEEHLRIVATKENVISNMRGVIAGMDAQYRSAFDSLTESLARQLTARIGADQEIARLERLVKLAFLSGPAGFALGWVASTLL